MIVGMLEEDILGVIDFTFLPSPLGPAHLSSKSVETIRSFLWFCWKHRDMIQIIAVKLSYHIFEIPAWNSPIKHMYVLKSLHRDRRLRPAPSLPAQPRLRPSSLCAHGRTSSKIVIRPQLGARDMAQSTRVRVPALVPLTLIFSQILWLAIV